MFAAVSQSKAPSGGSLAPEPIIQTDGRAEIRFKHGINGTSLDHLYHHDPVRVVFPTPALGDIPQGTIITTSGGLTGGDKINIKAAVNEGARAMIAAQAAEKIYRSVGPDVQIDVALTATSDAWLEYLPQETILFDGARLNRTTKIEAEPGAQVLAGEIIVLGRRGSGEIFQHGILREAWQVSIENRLTWADTLLLGEGKGGPLNHPAGFGGATTIATAVYVSPDAPEHLGLARELIACPGHDDIRSSATLVNGLLIVRWLGLKALPLRTDFGFFWQNFRHRVAGLPGRLPRLWDM